MWLALGSEVWRLTRFKNALDITEGATKAFIDTFLIVLYVESRTRLDGMKLVKQYLLKF